MFQSHHLVSDPVLPGFLARQNCKSYLQYESQKPQRALSVAETLGLLSINTGRGQRTPLAVGLRMLRCGWGTGLDNGRDWGRALQSGNRESWTIQILVTCCSIYFCRTAEQWDKFNPSKARSKEKKYLQLLT